MERYKDFLIDSSAVPTFATGFDGYSQYIQAPVLNRFGNLRGFDI
jgi:hypothetical protein